MRRLSRLAPFALALLLAALSPTRSRAEMWCAEPLRVHEWGVQVFGARGARRTTAGPVLPGYFHRASGSGNAAGLPVRAMEVDGGERELPVVHFYAPGGGTVPVGFEVGFAHGEATRWFPQVDGRRSASEANGASARAARQRLLAARRARSDPARRSPLGRDPTRQLAWDHLVLSEAPRHAAQTTNIAWVQRARAFPRALWVNGLRESERFLFYEGHTRERPAIRVTRAPSYAANRHHYLLHNDGPHPIHDVFVVHRDGARVFVFTAPTIPAGRHAGFLLEEHAVTAAELGARTRTALRDRLVDTREPAPASGYSWSENRCVMERDPAQPAEGTTEHRLYTHEVETIIEAWGARFFEATGTTIVYREDPLYLDGAMPISVYTDMFHFVKMRRLGLALMEGVSLP